MENTKNENLVNEKKLKDIAARVLNVQSFDAIDDETLKVVANDLFTHCTTAAFVQLDSDDLETFATEPKPFFIKIFKGFRELLHIIRLHGHFRVGAVHEAA